MIKVHNLQIIEDMPFEEYLQIKRISHSLIKNGSKTFKPSAATHLGTQVHTYLSEPARFDGNIKLVKALAVEFVFAMGGIDVYRQLKKEVTIFADFEYKGLLMEYKGRVDWLQMDRMVIDIKVSKDIDESIRFFRYTDAMDGYCIALNIPKWFIISGHPTKMDAKTGLNVVEFRRNKYPEEAISHYFWRQQVLKFPTRAIRKYV